MSTKYLPMFPRFSRDLVLGDYLYPGEPNGRVLVLGSPWLMGWLEERDRGGLVSITRLSIDATFKVTPASPSSPSPLSPPSSPQVTPSNYNQLLIVHARIGGEVWYGMVWYGMVWYGMGWYDLSLGDLWTPLFYILMPWRSRDCYDKVTIRNNFNLITSTPGV